MAKIKNKNMTGTLNLAKNRPISWTFGKLERVC